VQGFLHGGTSPIVGLPTGGAGESSHHHSLPPRSVPAQPSSSEVGGDEKYRKLFKHYHEARALLCASRLQVDRLRSDLVGVRTALVMA
jgi:hypothetical protein